MNTEVLLGLGANVGQPLAQLGAAVERFRSLFYVERLSSVYRSEPVGNADQPEFWNLVCLGYTTLAPERLLAEIHSVEHSLGRTRPFRNAPRTIDIDILAFGDLVLDTPELVIPHPRMHQRAFVLVPLAEIVPGWRHPVLGRTAREILASGGSWERVEQWGRLPGWTRVEEANGAG